MKGIFTKKNQLSILNSSREINAPIYIVSLEARPTDEQKNKHAH